MNIWPGVHFISFEFNFSRIRRGLVFSWVCTIRGRSHIAPKNAWKTLGALLSPFFQCARAVALRRRLSLLSNHQLHSPLQEGNFVTWPAVRLRHSEKLRCFYLDAVRTRLEKTSASHPRLRRFHYERAYRRVYIWNNELKRAKDAICERPLKTPVLPVCIVLVIFSASFFFCPLFAAVFPRSDFFYSVTNVF